MINDFQHFFDIFQNLSKRQSNKTNDWSSVLGLISLFTFKWVETVVNHYALNATEIVPYQSRQQQMLTKKTNETDWIEKKKQMKFRITSHFTVDQRKQNSEFQRKEKKHFISVVNTCIRFGK